MSNYDPNIISEKLRKLGHDWADKEAAASLLEETRKSLRAKLAIVNIGESVAKSEMLAEANSEYLNHVKLMVEARKLATIAKVSYDTAKIWVDLIRTQESTKRAEMQMK